MEPGFLSREIITARNDSPEKAQKRGERIILAEREEISEARRIIEGIDFTILKNILRDKLTRSGISPEQANFLPADRIVFYKRDKPDKAVGDYDPISNLISIDYYRLLNLSPEEVELLVLRTLVHEEVHAVSKSHCEIDIFGYDLKTESGFSEWDANDKNGFKFQCFEEGITEKLALEVTEEYCRSAGLSNQNLQKEKARVIPYTEYVKLVNLFIAEFSRRTGMTEDTVWRAVMEGKFKGRHISESNLRQEMDEVLPPGLLQKIEENRVKEAIEELEKFV